MLYFALRDERGNWLGETCLSEEEMLDSNLINDACNAAFAEYGTNLDYTFRLIPNEYTIVFWLNSRFIFGRVEINEVDFSRVGPNDHRDLRVSVLR